MTLTIDWQAVAVHLKLKTGNEPALPPRRDDFSSRDAYVEAMDRFVGAVDARRRFGAFCNGDGSFRVPNVPAGTYELEITLRDTRLDSVSPYDRPDRAREIASLVRELTIPEIPGGQSDEALDLGSVELVPRKDPTSSK